MKLRLLLVLLAISFSSAFGQDMPPKKLLPAGYYIVMAAYSSEDEANKQATQFNQKSDAHVSSGLDAVSKMYYIFVDRFGESDESLYQLIKTRREAGFGSAWVRVLNDGKIEKVDLLTQEREAMTKSEATATEKTTLTSSSTVTSSSDDGPAQPKMDPVKLPHTLKNTPVFLSLFNSQSNKIVNGEVQVIDGDRRILIKKVKGNEYFTMPDPKNTSGKITLVADVVGYRRTEKEINYKEVISRESEKYKEMFGNFILVDFDMIRYGVGDLATLSNVGFYTDAAIMLPESESELNNLLALMEEKTYKIVIHGHTNGNSQGKIITMGPDKTFFAITRESKQGFGSAKDLSKERAQVIKDWLVSKGIAADRIDVKGWGGSKMLFDKNSVNAKKNVRVEMEIVSN